MVIFKVLHSNNFSVFDFHLFISLIRSLIIQQRLWTLWYMACLFWINIIFYWLVKKIQKIKLLFLIVITMFIVGLLYYHFIDVALPWNIDVVMTSSIFFFAGYVFKLNYFRFEKYFTQLKSVILFLAFGIINALAGYFSIKLSGKGLDMFKNSYGFPPLTLLSAFAGILCVIIFAHWFDIRCIKYIGKNSMIYYAWHQTIMIPLVRLILSYVGIEYNEISSNTMLLCERMLELLIIVVLLTICHICISKTKLKFMIGR